MTNLISLITPTNLDSERDKFFSSSSYNPTFRYVWQDAGSSVKFRSPLKQSLWSAIRTQDHSLIVESAKQFFEIDLDQNTIESAKKAAASRGLVSRGSANEYVDLFRQALSEFDIEDINVMITDQPGFNARPDHIAKTVTISRHIQFSYFSMEGGVHHELAHILRYRNGEYNRIRRSPNYLPTEEGLASWCQDNANDDNGLAQHAMEYLASDIGLRGNLRDIYDTLIDLGMSPDLSWKRASRHKFGFVDTSQPGDIFKPAMYYANELKVAALSQDERLRLFVGKIALSDLQAHPSYTGIWSAEKLVKYFKL